VDVVRLNLSRFSIEDEPGDLLVPYLDFSKMMMFLKNLL